VIGLQGGTKAELDLGKLLSKRGRVIATTLRTRSVESKGKIVDEVVAHVWPMIADGRVRPVIGAQFPIEQAAAAHKLLASGEVAGKVILLVGD
jgi:NADPH:quinone reductase-like Zn-dependent oxidoreductase